MKKPKKSLCAGCGRTERLCCTACGFCEKCKSHANCDPVVDAPPMQDEGERMVDMSGTPIPREMAVKVCKEIQTELEKKLFAYGSLQCRACLDSSKKDPSKMCFAQRKDFRGCTLVNKRFDEKYAGKTARANA